MKNEKRTKAVQKLQRLFDLHEKTFDASEKLEKICDICNNYKLFTKVDKDFFISSLEDVKNTVKSVLPVVFAVVDVLPNPCELTSDLTKLMDIIDAMEEEEK